MGKTIAELITSLPEEERIILTLHFLKGKSSSEIAALLSVPERSVLSILESGKKRLTSEIGL
jgi:RNA polymerase sigma factor (sigma-70 family)